MKIELNAEEGQVLVNLLNVAVKAVGLEGAESALFFVKKLNAAAEADKAPPAMNDAPMMEAAE